MRIGIPISVIDEREPGREDRDQDAEVRGAQRQGEQQVEDPPVGAAADEVGEHAFHRTAIVRLGPALGRAGFRRPLVRLSVRGVDFETFGQSPRSRPRRPNSNRIGTPTMLKVPTAVLAALALAAAAAPSALAAQATGRVTFPLPGAEKAIKGEPPGSAVSALSMRADGGADIVGLAPGRKVVLARITRAGALDTSFGAKGFATPALPSGAEPRAAAAPGDGKLILVAGGPAGSKYQLPDYELARFNTDGTLDTSSAAAGSCASTASRPGASTATAAELTATGQIVLAAATGSIDPAIEHNPNAPQNFRFAVARLNSDGSLDPTFGDKGVATLPGFGYARAWLSGPAARSRRSASPGSPRRRTRPSQMVRLTPLGTIDRRSTAAPPHRCRSRRRATSRSARTARCGSWGLNASGATEVARYTALGAQDTSYGSGGARHAARLGGQLGADLRRRRRHARGRLELGSASPGIFRPAPDGQRTARSRHRRSRRPPRRRPVRRRRPQRPRRGAPREGSFFTTGQDRSAGARTLSCSSSATCT